MNCSSWWLQHVKLKLYIGLRVVVRKIIQNSESWDIWALKGYHIPKNTNIYLLGISEKKSYVYFERESVHVCTHTAGDGGAGEERIPSRLWAVSAEPDMGLNLTNCRIMTWAENKSQMLNWLSHTHTPWNRSNLNTCFTWYVSVYLVYFT